MIALLGHPDKIIKCERLNDSSAKPYYPGYPVQYCVFAPLIYGYNEIKHSGRGPGRHQIHFREGTVWLVVEDMNAYPHDEWLRNEQVVAKYGWPLSRAWVARGPYQEYLLYCTQGILVGINDIEARHILYFRPMFPTDCWDEFSVYLTYDRPKPIH